MTLGELVEHYRPHLADDPPHVRRSWEEMFRYTFKLYSRDTPLEAFDLDMLKDRLISADLHRPIVDGYVKRWGELLQQADRL